MTVSHSAGSCSLSKAEELLEALKKGCE